MYSPNPCKPGPRKHLVCEAALRSDNVEDVVEQLERLATGAGDKLSDYVRDLRSENNLDIRIEESRLRHHERLT